MRWKRAVTAACLAAGLLVSPVRPAGETLGIGADSAFAAECRLEITICQEFNVGFYRWETCWTARFFCG
jgi:hypothetical protein